VQNKQQDTVLLTLGRLPKGLELAFAFASRGWRVLVAEPWSWHLSRVSRAVDRSYAVTAPTTDAAAYHRDLAGIAEREAVDLVIPVSEETLHVAGLADRLPTGCRLFCPSLTTLLTLHDKLAFINAALAHDLPAPDTFEVGTPEAEHLAATRAHIIKPRLSSAGHGLQIRRAGEPLPGLDSPHVVQAYLPGEELCSFSIADRGRVIGTVIYRGLIVSGSVAVCFEVDPQPDEAVIHWIARFVAATRYSGFIAFDFRRDADGRALPIECNPRTTSGIHFVQPDDLVTAIERPEDATRWRLRDEHRLQQFYPALTETQGAAFKGREWKPNLKHLFGCRDVSWQARDPLPFLLMPLTSYQILRRTIFSGMTFGEAATFDIGWYEAS